MSDPKKLAASTWVYDWGIIDIIREDSDEPGRVLYGTAYVPTLGSTKVFINLDNLTKTTAGDLKIQGGVEHGSKIDLGKPHDAFLAWMTTKVGIVFHPHGYNWADRLPKILTVLESELAQPPLGK